MLLRITSIWRARPLRLGPSIPRQPLFALPRSTPFVLATRLRHSTLAEESEAFQKRIIKDSDLVKKPGAHKPLKKSENRVESIETTANEETSAEIKEIEHALERGSFADSVFVPRYKDLRNGRQRHRMMRAHHEAVTAQVIHERTRVSVGARPVDWRIVLEMMANSTPEQSLEYIEDGIKINADSSVLARILTSSGDEKLGAIRRRTGATIKVSGDKSTLLLSGTRQAINRASEEIMNIAGRVSVTRRFRPLEPWEAETEEIGYEKKFFIPPLSRDEGAYYKKTRLTRHVYWTPMPTKWTPKTLEDYVMSLLDTYFDPSLHSPIYTHRRKEVLLDHERAVTRQIMRLFHSLSSDGWLSGTVVKLAVSYMAEKGGKYIREARSLLVLLERRGISMDADVFNIMLKAPVKTRNLRQFQQTIKAMTWRGIAPNLDTWLLFLRMFYSVEVKSYILQAMNAKNLLGTPEAIQRVAQEMASYDAYHAITQRKSLASFCQDQENRYGRDWLTRDVGNKVLNVLGEYGRHEDACKLLDLMGERHYNIPRHHTQERLATRPDAASFASIINHARIEGKVPLVVNVVRKMKTRKLCRQPNPIILHLLFEMAWRARLRTTIVVIWRYASLARLTSYRMRLRVAALLSGELGGPEDRRMSATVYHKLGGERLACDLVGGREVLEQIKALCRRTWGKNYPRGKLGNIATKILPAAFGDYGPAIGLGQILSQSVSIDFKCLRAQKCDNLRDLLATAKVKSLPMWRRLKDEENWVDLAPIDDTEPAMIKHDDVWELDWASEGWHAPMRIRIAKERREKFDEGRRIWEAKKLEQADAVGRHTKSETSEEETDDVANKRKVFAKELEPMTEKRMVIINPQVWDDEKREVSAMGDDHRTELQRQDEQAILNALEQVSKDYMSSRAGFADREGPPKGPERKRYGEDSVAEDERAKWATTRGIQNLRPRIV